MSLFCYNGLADNHFCFRASLVVEKKCNNRIVVCLFAETTFNRTYMYIRHIDLKYLHLICILSVFYLFKNIIIRTFVYVWKPKNKRRRGLLRKCAFFVRIQAAINGFQTFYASNRAASPQLIQ